MGGRVLDCGFFFKSSHVRETPNLSTDANSSTNIFVSACVKKEADRIFFEGGGAVGIASCNDVYFCFSIFLGYRCHCQGWGRTMWISFLLFFLT